MLPTGKRNPETRGEQAATDQVLDLWITAARSGDRRALEALMGAIEQRVFTLAWRLTGDPALAEDVTQDSLFKICRKLSGYTPGGNWWGWVYRIVLNQVRDAQRRLGRRKTAEVDLETSPDPAPVARQDPARDEKLRRVAEAMSVLTKKERSALVLMDLEGFTSREAAKILGCLASTARSRAAHARKRVRQELRRYYPELNEEGLDEK